MPIVLLAGTHPKIISTVLYFKNPSMNKILITGGAGFLGSHLTEKLLKEGNDVLVVDNYFTGSKANLEHLLPNPRLELMRHDVTFPLYVYTHAERGLPAQANVIGFSMFFLALVIVVLGQVVQSKRKVAA